MSDLDNVPARAVENLQLGQTAAPPADPIVDTYRDLVEALAGPFTPSTAGIIPLAPEVPARWHFPPLEPFLPPPRDVIPPTVTSVIPGRDAKEVPLGTNVTVTFSEAMNLDTVRPETFTLVEEGIPTPVSATVSVEGKATLNPTGDLAPGSKYTATVKGGDAGVKDDEGTPLDKDYVWSFTTAADVDTTLPPPDTSIPPANQTTVPPNTKVAATVWIMIVVAFCLVLLGASYTLARLALGQAAEGFDPELMLTVFATAAGFLSGLLSPSPIGGR